MIRHGTVWKMLVLAGAGLAVAACATTTWNRSGATEAERQRDLSACQAEASAAVETRYGRQLPPHAVDPGGSSYDSQTLGGSQTFNTMMVRNEAIRASDRMVADCMRGRGYTWGRASSAK